MLRRRKGWVWLWSKERGGVGAPKPSRPQACVGGIWGVRRVWEERGGGGGGCV